MLLNLGNPEKALADLNMALRLEAGNAEAYRYRGTAKLRLGACQGAIDDLNQSL